MPRPARNINEINSIKQKILEHALKLINEEGFEGFSMRKLASKLGVKATTIYNYYENKDELYLAILTKGFTELYNACLKGYELQKTPVERLEAMVRAYVEFGFKKVNFYNLMFTWHVPKYKDYIGTPMEKAAYAELAVAKKVIKLFTRAIQEVAKPVANLTDKEARFYIVYFWSLVHGYIAGNNNNLLDYIYPHPEKLVDRIIELLFANIQRELLGMHSMKKQKNYGVVKI
ncbi:MAG: TetR/AcrR family transcriptional regulator [bacterium]